MILLNSKNKYEYLSNTILSIFFLLLLGSAIISDIFFTPTKIKVEENQSLNIFKKIDLLPVTKIYLKNKSGNYVFEKIDKNQISPWHMTSPRDVTANSIFIEKLFHALTSNKVKNLFPNDRINISNFSLEKPTTTVTFEGGNGFKPVTIDIGLLNTIDSTTFIRVSDQKNIYQIEALNLTLENATLLDLIESKIFSIDLDTINSFKVNFAKANTLGINIHKKNADWVNSESTVLAQDKVEEYFQNISVIKSSFVLDTQTSQQKKYIASLVKNPELIVIAEDNKKNIISYRISSLIYSFPDIELKNSPYFVVTISNNETAYIVKKEFLDLFYKKL